MQPEFITLPDSITAFAGAAGILAVAVIMYYSFSRSQRYEYLISQRMMNKRNSSTDELPTEE